MTATRPITPPIRIMLVDDHKTMLWGLEKMIESEASAMTVVGTASDGPSAVALATSAQPDVIVLDLDLNGNSSLEVLPYLLADGRARVLILSGNREQSLLAQAVRLGARGVVGKDATTDVVLKAIHCLHEGQLWLDQALMTVLLGGMTRPVPDRSPEAAKIATLTAKERKIIALVIEGNGASNKELAERAFVAEATLRNYLTSIYQKLDLSNRLELYVYATKNSLAVADAERP